jgi:hypothetical protein
MISFAGNSRRGYGPLAIAIVCVSQFMVILDVTIVIIALPAIRDGLEFSDADLQWVFTAYMLVFGGLLICGGRVADVAGRRRIFLIGLGLFSAASAGCTWRGHRRHSLQCGCSKVPERHCCRPPRWPYSPHRASLAKRVGAPWVGGLRSRRLAVPLAG